MIHFLIVLGLAFFVMLSSLRREWGIYLIILLLPAYQIRFLLGAVPMTFLESLILLLAIIEFINLLRKKKLLVVWQKFTRDPQLLVAILLFLVAAAIAVFVSPVKLKAAGIFKAYFFEAILFYFLVRLIIDTPEKLNRVWQSIALLVLYLSVFGIYQFLTLANLPFSWWAVDIASRRITSLLNHPNALALLLGPLLAMLLMLPKSNLLRFAVGFGTVALYLSFSRAAWLALVIVLLSFGLLTQHKKKILAAGLIIILAIIAIPYSRGKLFELVRRSDPSQQNRLVLWGAATDMLKKSPVLGVGLMGFREYYKNYPLGPDRVVQNYPHNFFLNFWVETGLFGLLGVIGLLIVFTNKIRGLLKNAKWRELALASAAGMGMIVLHSLVDVSYFKNDLSVLFWLIFALPDSGFEL